MSDLRIALISEGPTDSVIIEAALKAMLAPRTFTLTRLQPEATRPQMGSGWCGVFKWCRAFAARAPASLEEDPTLPNFDLFVVHLDADVADKTYADGGPELELAAKDMPALPCSQPCPPPTDSADPLRVRMLAWLGMASLGSKTVLCVPSKAIEAWLAAGVLDPSHALLTGLECVATLEARLAALPLATRIKKMPRAYREHAPEVTENWARVCATCTQAARFGHDVAAAL